MKRIANLWPSVTDAGNCVQAIVDGTRFKRKQREVQRFLYSKKDVEENRSRWHRIDPDKARPYAEKICASLADKTWRHQAPRHRVQFCRNRASNGGKWRDLYIPRLDDHIVAHLIMSSCMDAFTRGMHPHSCGSVPGRGIKHVKIYVERWMKHDLACRYFVKLDIRRFFDNIDRDRLVGTLKSKIKDPDAIWVFEQIIDSAPVACPVGYYTSPWFANLYLEKLDWYVEQQLYKVRRGHRIKYVRHYLRYVDDMLLIGTSKADLVKAIRGIEGFLAGIGLDIKPSWEIKAIGKHEIRDGKWALKPGTYWCDIGGYKFCKDATVLRPGIFLATRRLAHRMHGHHYTVRNSESINSRLGWASHCDCENFLRHEIQPYVNIDQTRRTVSYVDKSRER